MFFYYRKLHSSKSSSRPTLFTKIGLLCILDWIAFLFFGDLLWSQKLIVFFFFSFTVVSLRDWGSVATFHSVQGYETSGQLEHQQYYVSACEVKAGVCQASVTPLHPSLGPVDNVTVGPWPEPGPTLKSQILVLGLTQSIISMTGHPLSVQVGMVACQSPEVQGYRQKMPIRWKDLFLRSKLSRLGRSWEPTH